jgi:hypothetical protein
MYQLLHNVYCLEADADRAIEIDGVAQATSPPGSGRPVDPDCVSEPIDRGAPGGMR